jgi:hypothetical protein
VGAVGNDKLHVRVIFDVPNPSTCPGGHGASVPRSVPSPPSGVVGELHKSPVGEGSRKLERPLPSKGGQPTPARLRSRGGWLPARVITGTVGNPVPVSSATASTRESGSGKVSRAVRSGRCVGEQPETRCESTGQLGNQQEPSATEDSGESLGRGSPWELVPAPAEMRSRRDAERD